MITNLLKSILAALVATILFTSVGNAEPTGVWQVPDGKSHIEIWLCGEKLCGKIAWFTDPHNADGTLKVDEKNKNEALRTRPLLGLGIMSGFTETSDGKWTKGRIYNPEDGRIYRSKLEVKDHNTLNVSGCVLVFCKAQTWTRVK